MEKSILTLKFQDQNEEYCYENKITKIEDKNLIKNLEKPNINNENSSLIIKSMNDTPIYDVIQFKINVANTGVFLVNFSKDSIDENKRKELLEKISVLKSADEPTLENTKDKIIRLFNILNETKPIFITYKQRGELKIGFNELISMFGSEKLSCPVLVLEKTQTETTKFKIIFDVDSCFAFLFSLFLGFALTFGVCKIFEKESISTFFFIVASVFEGLICYIEYNQLFKKKVTELRNIVISLLLNICGLLIGLLLSFVIAKFVLKPGEITIDYNKVILISAPILLGTSILAFGISKLISLVIKKHKNN